MAALEGGNPNFDYAAMVWQAYWLSRDHFGPFVMASGMGMPFKPPMDMMKMAMGMVAQNPDDQVMLPTNMMPLQAVYASGSPKLANDPRQFDPLDFEAFRLDPETFDKTVSVRGQAETMLKESQWAHNFANEHFGAPEAGFGAQQRFMGIMVNMLAQMQAKYAMENLRGEDGLYHDSDGSLDYTANWVMLHTLSDIAGLSSADGRYKNPDMAPMFEGAASGLLQALQDREPESPEEAAAAIRALAYRAYTAADSAVRDDALSKLGSVADGLAAMATKDAVEQAAAIVGLVSAAEATGDDELRQQAASLFEDMESAFDIRHGAFQGKGTYTVDDVAWIIGGLNVLTLRGTQETQEAAKRVLMTFYEATMGVAGMQLSAPPGKNGAMAGEWEKDLPSVLYYHPENTLPPPMAGMLTTPAAEVTWDGESWSVTDTTFVTGGAMHLANELNWFGPHLGSIPFPPIAPEEKQVSEESAESIREIKVNASTFEFSPGELEVEKGETVKFTVTSADTFHTFSVKLNQDAAEDLFSIDLNGGDTKSVTHTFPESGTLYLYCKPHESLGMTGEIHVHE